jgi:multiple sugar transport system ATP-binding protein
VFLMDEPLSNLDAELRVHMRAEIAQLHRRIGVTFIYVTHDQAEAMTMSDRVVVMMGGRSLQFAPPGRVYGDPEDLQVARFVGSPRINTLPALVSPRGTLELDIGGGAKVDVAFATGLAPGSRVTLGLRPSDTRLAVVDGARTAREGEAGVPARIVHRENLGSDLFVHVRVDGVDGVVVAREDPLKSEVFVVGAPVQVVVPAAQVLVFDESGRRVRRRGGVSALGAGVR